MVLHCIYANVNQKCLVYFLWINYLNNEYLMLTIGPVLFHCKWLTLTQIFALFFFKWSGTLSVKWAEHVFKSFCIIYIILLSEFPVIITKKLKPLTLGFGF